MDQILFWNDSTDGGLGPLKTPAAGGEIFENPASQNQF